eukprot:13428870-Ditylum_brightwellii.AAC.1
MVQGSASHTLVTVSVAPRDTYVIIVRIFVTQPAIDPIAALGEGVDFIRPINAPGHGTPGWDTGSVIIMKVSSLSIILIGRTILSTA